MVSVREKGLLLKIIEHCEKIETKIKNLTDDQFVKNEDLVEIVCFNILQIGELAKNFGPEFFKKYPNQPWKEIKGMRDKVAHGYGAIDLKQIWLASTNDIPPLLEYCRRILKD